MNKQRIEELAEICANKELTFEGHQLASRPEKYDQRVEAAKKYAVAKAEAFEARRNLEAAIQGGV